MSQHGAAPCELLGSWGAVFRAGTARNIVFDKSKQLIADETHDMCSFARNSCSDPMTFRAWRWGLGWSPLPTPSALGAPSRRACRAATASGVSYLARCTLIARWNQVGGPHPYCQYRTGFPRPNPASHGPDRTIFQVLRFTGPKALPGTGICCNPGKPVPTRKKWMQRNPVPAISYVKQAILEQPLTGCWGFQD